MGLGQKILTWVWLGQFFVAPVESAIFGLGLENFLPSGQKNLFELVQKVSGSKMDQRLIFYRSKVCSGRVRAHLYLR